MTTTVATIRLVIADDADDFRFMLRVLLENHEHLEVVGEATNGDEAVSLTEQLQPDLLLLDLAMPRTDGLEALSRIRSRDAEVPVIILTGFAAADARDRAVELGATEFIEKGPAVRGLPELVVELCSEGRSPTR